MSRSPPPGVVEYGWIGALLVLLTVLETVLSDGLRTLLERSLFHVTPDVYGAIIYSAVGLTSLGIGFVAYRRLGAGTDRRDGAEFVQPLSALALAVVAVSYVVSNLVPPSASLFQSFAVSVAGTGVLSVAYVRLRAIDLRIGAPEGPVVHASLVAGLGPALLVGLSFLVLDSVGAPRWVLGGQHPHPVSVLDVGLHAVLASVFAAFGAGLLFYGAIQETIREFAAPTGAIAGITVLVGLHRAVTLRLIALDRVTLLVAVLPAVAFVVLATALVVRLWRGIDRTVRDARWGLAAPVAFGTLVMGSVLVAWYGATGVSGVWLAGYALVYTVTVGTAAAAYERTRSVRVPMLAIASFHASTDLAPYLLPS